MRIGFEVGIRVELELESALNLKSVWNFKKVEIGLEIGVTIASDIQYEIQYWNWKLKNVILEPPICLFAILTTIRSPCLFNPSMFFRR